MSNKNKVITGGITATLTALFLAVFGSVQNADITGHYTITNVNEYTSEVVITLPDNFTPDVCTLKVNDLEVTKCLLPNGKFVTHPIVTSDVSNLSVDFAVRGEHVGVGLFEGDEIHLKVKEEFIHD